MFALAACSSTGGTSTFIPQTAEPTQSTIYFYRPNTMSNAMYSPELYVNGEFKLSIKNGQVSRLALPAGETTIEIAPDEHYSSVNKLALNMQAGAIYFVRVDTTLTIENATAYEPYFRSFSLASIADEIAISEITECCSGKSRKKDESPEHSSTTIKTDDSFSVDKTQNPFSH
jgi:hypothetical protein